MEITHIIATKLTGKETKMKTLALIFLLTALLIGYKLGHKAAQDIKARQSETEYIEQYLNDHQGE